MLQRRSVLLALVSVIQAQFGLREADVVSLQDTAAPAGTSARTPKCRGSSSGVISMAVNSNGPLLKPQARPTLYDVWTNRQRDIAVFFLAGVGVIKETPYV